MTTFKKVSEKIEIHSEKSKVEKKCLLIKSEKLREVQGRRNKILANYCLPRKKISRAFSMSEVWNEKENA